MVALARRAEQRAAWSADLVLPSPNGSAISAAASATGLPVVAACLRNARAVGRWLRRQGYGTVDAPIGVIASGERWPDGSLRPSVEDQLGAASVLDALSGVPGGLSVEAAMALAALASTPDVPGRGARQRLRAGVDRERFRRGRGGRRPGRRVGRRAGAPPGRLLRRLTAPDPR